VVIHPLFLNEPGFDVSVCQAVSVVPSVEFAAYHPDLCYASAAEGHVQGPLGTYQSILTLAGREAGLSVEQTVALFNDGMFQACGYYDLWPTESTRLLNAFKAQNLDLSDDLRLWSHGACFMHSFDHPKITCVFSVARALLRTLGIEPIADADLPNDNLRNGASWAVYPEIGDRYGVRGAYLFKAPTDYRQIALAEFVEGSFRALDAFTDIKVMGAMTGARYAAAQALLTRRS
jgi:hypothetical protein